jgi:acetyl-CoA carboxylase carboxyltransferase component
MPAAGAARAAGSDELIAAELQEQESGGPWRLADTLSYDEVVAPGELRDRLVASLRLALLGRRDTR